MKIDAQLIFSRVGQLNRVQSEEMCELIKQGCDATVALTLVEKAYPTVVVNTDRTATMGRVV